MAVFRQHLARGFPGRSRRAAAQWQSACFDCRRSQVQIVDKELGKASLAELAFKAGETNEEEIVSGLHFDGT